VPWQVCKQTLDFGNNLAAWSARPFALPRYASSLKNWIGKEFGSIDWIWMEAWKLQVCTIIVSEAFFNNWVDFLFVEKYRDEVTGK
jgi:hypothetical protein